MNLPRTSRLLRVSILPLALILASLTFPAATGAAGGYNTVTLNAECDGVAGDGWHAAIIKLKAKIVATRNDARQLPADTQRRPATEERRQLAGRRASDPRR